MIYGLTGASCSGKTTLAKELSKKLGIPFIPTSITEMAAEAGLPSPVADLNFIDRMNFQVGLLKAFERFLGKIDKPCIIDRTPVDLLAYTYAEVGMHSTKNALANRTNVFEDYDRQLIAYRALCLKLIYTYKPFIIFLRRLPDYEFNDYRPPIGFAYQIHCETLIKGFLSDILPDITTLDVEASPLKDRLNLVYSEICDYMAEQRLKMEMLKKLN